MVGNLQRGRVGDNAITARKFQNNQPALFLDIKYQSHHQEDFRHRNFQGCSGVVGVFYFERYIYNYSDNGGRALILLKIKMRISLGKREYMGT